MALKKGSFRMTHRNWWRWVRAKKIRRETLLVLVALETGPWGAGQYTGLYHVSVSDIADYTGLTDAEVKKALDALERIGGCVYDSRKQLVFVRGMLARQSPSFASTENNLRGVSNHVERMPENSRAVQEFIKAQRNVPELYELLEGYLEGEDEGESEGYFEQTLDLRPGDLRPGDLRPGDLDTGDKETVIPPNDREMTRTSSNLSSKSNSKGKVKVASLNAPQDPKPRDAKQTKGNGHDNDQGAAKGNDGQTDLAYAIKSLPPNLRSFAAKVAEEAAAGLMSRPKGREQLREAGLSAMAADVLIPRKATL